MIDVVAATGVGALIALTILTVAVRSLIGRSLWCLLGVHDRHTHPCKVIRITGNGVTEVDAGSVTHCHRPGCDWSTLTAAQLATARRHLEG